MTEQPFTGTESINQLRGAVAALRDYADTLGVDATFDQGGEWWDGYRQAQRGFIAQTNRRIKDLEAKLEAAITSYTADRVPMPITAQTVAQAILDDYMQHSTLYRKESGSRGWNECMSHRCNVFHDINSCCWLNITADHFSSLIQTTTTHAMRTDFAQAMLRSDGEVFHDKVIDNERIRVVTVCIDALEVLAHPVRLDD